MTSNSTQLQRRLEAAIALVQIYRLHPELADVTWTVSPDAEGLTGSYWDAPADAVDTVVAALDGDVHTPWTNPKTGRVSQVLTASFQDVPVTVTVYSPARVMSAVAA